MDVFVMFLIFDPNDFVVDATGRTGVVEVFVGTAGAPEMSASAFDE